ncbi:uncharacterized protein BJ171DRAFT_491393 [Polychytrium aggregatum]|uniref:uncharacterized protein n=1 Tax=Polychytrium aggregatum TaxID=110093 RepID=UPI0022FE7C34|nr:uncharacterized protein BJ171DRAFT_491393 [Polychytrium aggregatum]KAI9207767.1 hypothetical protein BJ171DRAFT_491393 [Polychytrium aggregatum]
MSTAPTGPDPPPLGKKRKHPDTSADTIQPHISPSCTADRIDSPPLPAPLGITGNALDGDRGGALTAPIPLRPLESLLQTSTLNAASIHSAPSSIDGHSPATLKSTASPAPASSSLAALPSLVHLYLNGLIPPASLEEYDRRAVAFTASTSAAMLSPESQPQQISRQPHRRRPLMRMQSSSASNAPGTHPPITPMVAPHPSTSSVSSISGDDDDVGLEVAGGRPSHPRISRPLSEEERKERRLRQNRLAARGSRQKKKQYIEELEQRIRRLEEENSRLRAANRQAAAETKRISADRPKPRPSDPSTLPHTHHHAPASEADRSLADGCSAAPAICSPVEAISPAPKPSRFGAVHTDAA